MTRSAKITESLLDELLGRLESMSKKDRKHVEDLGREVVKNMKWVPNPGPQTEAYFSEADEIFYGGQAGGGKSDLILGYAINESKKALILRKFVDDSRELSERFLEILGHRNGWRGDIAYYSDPNGQRIKFSGCQHEKDKQRFKGKAHDLKAFDEITDFPYSVYAFIKTWNRSAEGNKCRVICTGNPPTDPEGLWVVEYWAPWLDPEHPNPAESGELRWFITGSDDLSLEVEGPGEYEIEGEEKPAHARSRTFIRSTLDDNPDLAETDYDAVLSALPADLRAAYRNGEFQTTLKDRAMQVIPSAWVKAAQDRWKENPAPPSGVPMCAIGVDCAQGGSDDNIIAPRYDGWYAKLIKIPGKETPLGTDLLGDIIKVRTNQAKIIIDVGGGYGSVTYTKLVENGISVTGYKGSKGSTARSKDGIFTFQIKRDEAIWRFREALDPETPGGSRICLPPGSRIFSDLTSLTYKVHKMCVKIDSKEELVKRLGRSPDEGDAVIMAWSDGDKIESSFHEWESNKKNVKLGRRPVTIMSSRRPRRSR